MKVTNRLNYLLNNLSDDEWQQIKSEVDTNKNWERTNSAVLKLDNIIDLLEHIKNNYTIEQNCFLLNGETKTNREVYNEYLHSKTMKFYDEEE